jgi:hypothetical protein
MKRGVLVAMGVALSVAPLGDAQAAPGESSFTPTSFVMPIYSIMLARGLTVNVPLYSCRTGAPATSGSDAGLPGEADAGTRDCRVDMADEAALTQLFSEPAYIPPGTYDSIVVMTCESNSAFEAQVKGSVVLEDVTYYTTAVTPFLSTNPADQGYTPINYGGCGNTVQLSPPLVVAEGDSLTVSAFFTLQNLSWVLGNFSPGLGGCAAATAGEKSVCSGLPVLVGYIGAAAPTLDAFYITEDPSDLVGAQAAGQVLLLSSGGEPFSGFLRRVYSHDSTTPSVSYDVPLREITKNADVTLDGGAPLDASALDAGTAATYDVYAIGDPFQDLTRYRVRFPRFELQNHTGTFFTANGASQVDYRAIKR